MFVMVAIWGLVTFISQTFNIGLGGQVARPEAIPVQKTNNTGVTQASVQLVHLVLRILIVLVVAVQLLLGQNVKTCD